MTASERLVWVVDGERCYTKLVQHWLLNEDGTTSLDGRVVTWMPFK